VMENIVIVNSCDGYEDVWDLFFCAFREYWPDCKYQVVLNTESKQRDIAGINVRINNLKSMSDRKLWGKRLRQTIESCNSEYVLMLYDDFILEGPVSEQKISRCMQSLSENPDIAAFYFLNVPVNKNIDDGRFDGFELMPKTADYKLNSAPALWRRERLLAYIEDNDNPWAWEYFGSYRAYNNTDLFYCAKRGAEDVYPYNYVMGGAIYRGRWVGKVVLPLIEKYGLDTDVSVRGLVDDVNQSNKRSLSWKIQFFWLGYRMIGTGVFLYVFRNLKVKFFKRAHV